MPGPGVITGILVRGAQAVTIGKMRCDAHTRGGMMRFEEEEGAAVEACRQPLAAGPGKETSLSLKPPEGRSHATPGRQASDLRECKGVNADGLEPRSLRSPVAAATANSALLDYLIASCPTSFPQRVSMP